MVIAMLPVLYKVPVTLSIAIFCHSHVVSADAQLFGMTAENISWDAEELEVAAIDALQPRPLFCCICGDMVDMTVSIFAGQPKDIDGAAAAATHSTTTAAALLFTLGWSVASIQVPTQVYLVPLARLSTSLPP